MRFVILLLIVTLLCCTGEQGLAPSGGATGIAPAALDAPVSNFDATKVDVAPAADGVEALEGGGVDAGDAADSVGELCTPECAGKECGPNGCGGQCGQCASGEKCASETGQCKPTVPADPCAGLGGCKENAVCVVKDGVGQCKCKPYYEGDPDVGCTDVNECKKANGGCDVHADCENKVGAENACNCVKGWTGNGFKCTEIDECTEGLAGKPACGPNTTCKNLEGTFQCKCKGGYEGDPIVGCADTDECANGEANCPVPKKCVNLPPPAQFKCMCPDGYSEDGKACVDVDECAAGKADCAATATCINKPGGYTCVCPPALVGDGKVCVKPDKCATANGGCDANATCKTGPDDKVVCSCKAGYSGDGVLCADVDECLTANGGCDANATCKNIAGLPAECACTKGYSGDGKSCADDNECALGLAKCAQNAVCKNTPGKFECACKPGFAGDGASNCDDVDECKVNPAICGAGGKCTNTVGSYDCGCGAGFEGTPPNCKDLDECATGKAGCDANAACTNTPGKYQCKCKVGFVGDGAVCTDVNECKVANGGCDPKADCGEVVGGPPKCQCPLGLDGGGQVCYPQKVDVQFHGVLIKPTNEVGDCWDGGCSFTAAELQKVKSAVDKAATAFSAIDFSGVATAAKVAAFLLDIEIVQNAIVSLVVGLSAPDAKGSVEFSGAGSFTLPEKSNTYAPIWSGAAWQGVELGPTKSLGVFLKEVDQVFDDGLGAATVNAEDLKVALIAAKNTAIPTNDQAPGTILAVIVSVKPATKCGDKSCGIGETATNCPIDCNGAICNNGKCESTETATTCPWDCQQSSCGNGQCDAGEDPTKCPSDCKAGPACGNFACEAGESATSCPADCAQPSGKTCKGLCGGKAPSGCWCDASCTKNNDCCPDKPEQCDPGCKGKCGKESFDVGGKACFCDNDCVKYGDCCADKATFCP